MTARSRSTRARGLAALATVAVVGTGVVGLELTGLEVAAVRPAGAAGTTSTTQAAVALPGGGLSFRGAVVTAPGKPTRNLTAYQSAVFVQKWIVEALYGKPKHEPIPANVTPYRVDVTGTWGGGSDFEARPVFYASDGTQAWVVFPDPAKVPPTGIPTGLDWFVAPPQVIGAFAGTGKLVPTAAPAPPPTTTGGAAPTGNTSSGDDWGGSAWLWIVGVVAVVAVGGATLGWRRSRARSG